MKNTTCLGCLVKSKAAEHLKDTELNILGQSCVVAIFKKGETIFKQNALSSNIIYLRTGMVKLTIQGPQRSQILRLKKAPGYLGLPTTIGDKINHYSAVALEDTTACYIDIGVFRELLKINSSFSYEIIIELCRNELHQFNRTVKLVQNQIYGRLAAHLLYLSNEIYNSNEFYLPLTRNEIADLIYTSRETVSRILNDLARENIIHINGKEVRILNISKLKKISEKG